MFAEHIKPIKYYVTHLTTACLGYPGSNYTSTILSSMCHLLGTNLKPKGIYFTKLVCLELGQSSAYVQVALGQICLYVIPMELSLWVQYVL